MHPVPEKTGQRLTSQVTVRRLPTPNCHVGYRMRMEPRARLSPPWLFQTCLNAFHHSDGKLSQPIRLLDSMSERKLAVQTRTELNCQSTRVPTSSCCLPDMTPVCCRKTPKWRSSLRHSSQNRCAADMFCFPRHTPTCDKAFWFSIKSRMHPTSWFCIVRGHDCEYTTKHKEHSTNRQKMYNYYFERQ